MQQLDLQPDARSFDAVLDKATFDSVLCGEGGAERAERMLSEISRVLKPGGTFVMLSNAAPEERLATHLEKPDYGWTCHSQPIPKPGTAVKGSSAALGTAEGGGGKFFYVYTMQKVATDE